MSMKLVPFCFLTILLIGKCSLVWNETYTPPNKKIFHLNDKPESYITHEGDTLANISDNIYHSSTYWLTIYRINKRLWPNTVLDKNTILESGLNLQLPNLDDHHSTKTEPRQNRRSIDGGGWDSDDEEGQDSLTDSNRLLAMEQELLDPLSITTIFQDGSQQSRQKYTLHIDAFLNSLSVTVYNAGRFTLRDWRYYIFSDRLYGAPPRRVSNLPLLLYPSEHGTITLPVRSDEEELSGVFSARVQGLKGHLTIKFWIDKGKSEKYLPNLIKVAWIDDENFDSATHPLYDFNTSTEYNVASEGWVSKKINANKGIVARYFLSTSRIATGVIYIEDQDYFDFSSSYLIQMSDSLVLTYDSNIEFGSLRSDKRNQVWSINHRAFGAYLIQINGQTLCYENIGFVLHSQPDCTWRLKVCEREENTNDLKFIIYKGGNPGLLLKMDTHFQLIASYEELDCEQGYYFIDI